MGFLLQLDIYIQRKFVSLCVVDFIVEKDKSLLYKKNKLLLAASVLSFSMSMVQKVLSYNVTKNQLVFGRIANLAIVDESTQELMLLTQRDIHALLKQQDARMNFGFADDVNISDSGKVFSIDMILNILYDYSSVAYYSLKNQERSSIYNG